MICDKCKILIDQNDENWQRFSINEEEITLCECCVKGFYIFMGREE